MRIQLERIDDLEISVVNNVIALIDEGVSNAIRHAKSTEVSVSCSRVDTDLRVEIRSNGSEMTEHTPGLGTRLFNELANAYSYAKRGDLNHLQFTVCTDKLVGL